MTQRFEEQKARIAPLIQQVRHLFAGLDATLYLYDPEGAVIEMVLATQPRVQKFVGARLPLGEGVAGTVARTRQAMYINDYEHWAGRSPRFEELPNYNILSAPLLHKGTLYGVLNLTNENLAHTFSDHDMQLFQAVADLVVLSLVNAQLHEWTHQSEQRFRNLVEDAHVGVYVVQNGRLVYANPFMEAFFDRPLNALQQMPFEDLVAPEDRAQVRAALPEPDPRETGARTHHHAFFKVRRGDGALAHVEVFGSLILYNGRPAIQGMMLDITARQETQLLLQRFLDIGTRILSESEMGVILQQVCDALTAHSPFQTAAIIVFERPVRPEQAARIGDLYITGVDAEVHRKLQAQRDNQHILPNRDILSHGVRLGPGYHVTPKNFPDLAQYSVPVSKENPTQAAEPGWGIYDNFYLFLWQGELIWGRISLARPQDARVPEATTLEPLGVLANLATLAVHNARQIKALESQKDHLHRLHRFGQKLAAAGDQQALLTLVIETLREDFSYDVCAVLLIEFDKLVVAAQDMPGAGAAGLPAHIPLNTGITGWVAANKQPCLCNDVSQDPRYNAVVAGSKSELCVPILFESETLGVINIESDHLGAFEAFDLELLSTVAAQTALALINLRRYQDLKDQAARDALTGLYNRRHFNEVVEREFQRAVRYRHSIGIVFLDVDGMHAINNAHGHQHGDHILCKVAQLLRQTVRTTDLLFRYGGDEFMVLLPQTNGEVERVMARLQEAQARWNARRGAPPLHLSMGGSHWTADQDRTLEELIQEADLKMFQQKRTK